MLLKMANCPKHAELILEINKLLLLHLVGFSILLYLPNTVRQLPSVSILKLQPLFL
jgi:hypothetical protein